MGADFAIIVEPRTVAVGDISDAELEAYHRDHSPPGSPPLAVIREHVAHAVALGRSTEPDPIDALHSRFVDDFGRDRVWWDRDLEAAAARLGMTPLAQFQVEAPRWCDAAEGVRTVHALRSFLRETHPERIEQLECLALVEQILVNAEQGRRRWRLLVMW